MLVKRIYWTAALVAIFAIAATALTAASPFASGGGPSPQATRCEAEAPGDKDEKGDKGDKDEAGDKNEKEDKDEAGDKDEKGDTSEAGDKDEKGEGKDCPEQTPTPQACGTDNGQGCAPLSDRVDLGTPKFSNPLKITNPLFPISDLHSALLLGHVDGLPFRTETTLLPGTKTIDLYGTPVKTRVSQYVAYLDGEIHEVALDFYAQADDGAVWYLGEDVFNFEAGTVADTKGTWLAGKDGPAAMIMPANPQVGDVYRPENAPGFVFEEVTVKSIGVTVDGPHGPVPGAILVEELHMDGSREGKTFAPGYGEFLTGNVGGDLEALALAVPADKLSGAVPPKLAALSSGADAIFAAAGSGDWPTASAQLSALNADWAVYEGTGVPPMVAQDMDTALAALSSAVAARNGASAQNASLDVARSALDFQLRYRPVSEIDLARFELWSRQALIDTAAGDFGLVLGDVTALEWARDRFAHALDSSERGQINGALKKLRAAANAENPAAVRKAATRLHDLLADITI